MSDAPIHQIPDFVCVWITRYTTMHPTRGRADFAGILLANDFDEAIDISERRGRNETFEYMKLWPPGIPLWKRMQNARKLSKQKTLEMIHEALYLIQTALAAKVITYSAALKHDQALMHEFVHYIQALAKLKRKKTA